MKKSLLTLALAVFGLTTFAQTPAAPLAAGPTPTGTAEPLGSIIRDMNSGPAADAATMTSLVTRLERAAAAAPTDWLPRYYQAYALLGQERLGQDAHPDALLDRADAALKQARELHGDESEILALQANIYQGRLTIDPMQRARNICPW